ncbi:MAG TPA: S8 family peptidase [Rubrobacteraceae bacterium]|nr:S8 family peptidase [Rubrobacteraceae bacterium]
MPEDAEKAVPGQIIVKFRENVGPSMQASVRRDEGLEKVKDLPLIDAEVDKVRGQSVEQAIRDLERRPNVEYAEPDHILYATGYADEPWFSDLWGLHNTGQSIWGSTGTPNVDVNGLEASTVTQGKSDLVVAVIDDGVDFSHVDLADRAWKNPGESGSGKETNAIDDDGNGYVDDVYGWDFYHDDKTVHDRNMDFHGTHVAGTIAASVNDMGVVGVAPNVKVMALKFLSDDDGDGSSTGSTSDAIDAIQYAKSKGAKLSNNSWGGGAYNQALKDAIDASGQLFVASAGNGGFDGIGDNNDVTPSYPASYDSANILSVAAVNNRGNFGSFSNYGATSVDISAPGVDVLSAYPGNFLTWLSGTSMAAPHVTGVAALAASVDSGLLSKPVDLKNLVMNTGKPLSATVGKTVTGDMVNGKAAVDAAAPPDTTPPNTTITSGPSGTVKSTSASFGFSSSEAGSKFQCKLDGASWQNCASPKSYTGLSNGAHTFRVRAIDSVGNVDATPAVRRWTVDTIKPAISGMTPKPGSTINDRTPTIRAKVTDNLTDLKKANIKLYVNTVLISPKNWSYDVSRDLLIYNSPMVPKGKKTVKIVATDAAKNAGAKSWSFTIN